MTQAQNAPVRVALLAAPPDGKPCDTARVAPLHIPSQQDNRHGTDTENIPSCRW